MSGSKDSGARPVDRERVKKIFTEALLRDVADRASFVASACGDDPKVRAEVLSLLEHHRGDTVLDVTPSGTTLPPTVAKAEPLDVTGKAKRRRRAILLAGASLALIAVLAIVLNVAIRRATSDLVRAQLETGTDAIDTGLMAVLSGLEEHAAVEASDSVLVELVTMTDTGDAAANASRILRLRDRLTRLLRNGQLAAGIADERGVIIAATRAAAPEANATRLNAEAMALLARVRETGKPIVRMPYGAGGLLAGSAPALDSPVFCVFAPIVDSTGAFRAALGIVVDPSVHLTPFFTAQRPGQTGEAYAFDSRGVMLSESRFDPELRRAGILPNDPTAGSALRVKLTDPGRDLSTSKASDVPIQDRPLTAMVASATAGVSSIDLGGYKNYLGKEVVGAWRWYEGRDFGFAIEIERAEAFRPARLLRLGSWALLALLATAFLLLVRSTHVESRLESELARAERFGRYQLLKKLGEGGMGQVWLAKHAMLSRPVALKLIRADAMGQEAIAAFEREVELTSRLTHPNVIAIYDYGIASTGEPYYVMEYLDGIDLKHLVMKSGPLAPARVAHVLREVCSALIEAHESGLVHRDIKASNVMLCRRGGIDDSVELLDFGLVIERSGASSDASRIGCVSGTPPYIPPERWRDPASRDPRSDLYSVGVLAYFLLTGTMPFGDDVGPAEMGALIDRILKQPAARPSLYAPNAMPPALEQLVMDLLEKDPNARPKSAREVVTRLSDS